MIITLILYLASALQEEVDECSCKESKIGDLHCDKDCNVEACNFDNGDCEGQECNCDESMLGDSICNWECVKASCEFDKGDCCANWMLYNDFCDAPCYVEKFKYDNGNCKNGLGNCQWTWDSVFDEECQYGSSDHPECLNDMGDCCFEFEVGDGHCEEYCYDPKHDFDKGDCFKEIPEGCECWGNGLLGNNTCLLYTSDAADE